MAKTAEKPVQDNTLLAMVAAATGWLVPGLGHLLLRKPGKAVAYFIAVGTLAVIGLLMRGNVFTYGGGGAFGMLGFLADLGSGVFYFLAHVINAAGPDVARASGDDGTRLIATAGVLNLLCVLEAFETGLQGKGKEHPPE
jgi:TM2 domain-containing membrane protein YozV